VDGKWKERAQKSARRVQKGGLTMALDIIRKTPMDTILTMRFIVKKIK
jgi:hypothetical protein